MVWEESTLDVYCIRSAHTNGEPPMDRVIATGQQGGWYRTVLLLPPLASLWLLSFSHTHPHRRGHTQNRKLITIFSKCNLFDYVIWKINEQFYIILAARLCSVVRLHLFGSSRRTWWLVNAIMCMCVWHEDTPAHEEGEIDISKPLNVCKVEGI